MMKKVIHNKTSALTGAWMCNFPTVDGGILNEIRDVSNYKI